jgi:hypothetical protein
LASACRDCVGPFEEVVKGLQRVGPHHEEFS